MKPLYYLICIALFVTSSGFRKNNRPPEDECKSISAHAVISDAANGVRSVTIEITKGNQSTAQYIFCEEKGKVLNPGNFRTNSLENLPRGNYFCVVSTSDCARKISFKIK
jgi:hypothetical protein